MAERTLVENVAQAKADFKAVKDAIYSQVGYDLDNVPTNEYGNKVNDACTEMYGIGKEDGIAIGYGNGKSDGIDEGYTSGKADGIYEGIEQEISKSKYIEKTASGKVIRLDDVSEVYHNVKVKADTPTEVRVYGKNLCDYTKFTGISVVDKANVILDNDTFIFPAGNTYYGLTMTGGIALVKGQTYTFSYEATTAYAYPECQIIYTDDTRIVAKNGTTITIADKDIKEIKFYLVGGAFAETDAKLSKFQVELGTKGTYYELPTHQTITATPSGTEVASICPIMAFLADNEITVDYYGSYGKAEAELAMWNSITNYGKRVTYGSAFSYCDFSGRTIPNGLCKPITVIGSMFYVYQGVELPMGVDCSGFDFTTTTTSYHCYNMFAYSPNLKRIYDMNIPAGTKYIGSFRNDVKLEYIEKIRANETTTFDNNVFNTCINLTHCIFEGIIADNINLQWSPKLDLESLGSLFRCLKNFKADDPDNVHTKTITLSAESWTLLDTYVYENGWNDYVNAKDVVSTVLGWNYA